MAVDQIDRAITARRYPSPVNQVGRSVSRIGRGGSGLIRRTVAIASGLIETVAAAVPGLLRYVVRAAGGLIARVSHVVVPVLRGAVTSLRRVTG
jgi:hypothetical protein